jgi:DNA-binding NarL/FixJ family response regulator
VRRSTTALDGELQKPRALVGANAMSIATKIRPTVAKYRVLIVDDHPIIREGLTRFICQEPDIEICAGADNVEDAMRYAKELRPDLVVVDMSLKGSHGIELITQLKAFDERIKTLVWSMFDEKIYAERALRAGAMGYVNKQEPIETVIAAIRQVLLNDVYLSPTMTSRVLQRLGSGKSLEDDPVESLSNREVEVFRMVGRGMTTQHIAEALGVRPKTIEAHREKIKAKLNLKNAAELNCRAVQWVLENG